MDGNFLGVIVEMLVAGLLAVTIGYCVIVNRKLESLRADKSDLRAIIRDLYAATGHAEKAIGTLRVNATSLESSLGEQVDRARKSAKRLSEEVDRGEALLSKLAVIAKNNPARSDVQRQMQAGAAAPQKSAAQPRARLGLGLLRETAEEPLPADSPRRPAQRDAA